MDFFYKKRNLPDLICINDTRTDQCGIANNSIIYKIRDAYSPCKYCIIIDDKRGSVNGFPYMHR